MKYTSLIFILFFAFSCSNNEFPQEAIDLNTSLIEQYGNIDNADLLNQFEEAIQRFPDYPYFYANRMNILIREDSFEFALEDARKLQNFEALDDTALFVTALLEFKLGDNAAFENTIEKVYLAQTEYYESLVGEPSIFEKMDYATVLKLYGKAEEAGEILGSISTEVIQNEINDPAQAEQIYGRIYELISYNTAQLVDRLLN
jgi:hypothetical protein